MFGSQIDPPAKPDPQEFLGSADPSLQTLADVDLIPTGPNQNVSGDGAG